MNVFQTTEAELNEITCLNIDKELYKYFQIYK